MNKNFNPMRPRPDEIITREFVLLLLCSMLFSAALHLTLPIIPLYWKQLGFREETIGVLLALFSLGTVLTMPTIGKLIDRQQRKPFLLLGLALFGLPFPAYLLASQFPSIALLRFVQGLGIACFLPALYSSISDVSPPTRRGEAMGMLGVVKSIIYALLPAQGLRLVETTGFQAPFLLVGVLTLAGIALSFALPPGEAAAAKEQRKGKGIRQVMAMPPVAVAIFILFTATTAHGTTNFIPIWGEVMGIGNVGLFYTGAAMSMLVASLLGGRLSDRLGRLQVVLPGLFLLGLSLLVLGAAQNLFLLVLGGFLFGSGFGVIQAVLNAYIIDVTEPNYRGTAIGVYQTSFDLGLGFGQLSFGLLLPGLGYATAYNLMALLTLGSFCGLALHIPNKLGTLQEKRNRTLTGLFPQRVKPRPE